MRTVRDATYDVMRRQGMTTIFSNPGSTEVAFLVDLPDDLQFVLALHEGSVVGIASGWAIARRDPAFVLLHTTAGLGNAVGAIATARVNHAPLVVVVGQQDRRHLSLEPFLAGRLRGLAGEYPLETIEPVLAEDVPAAVERAAHRARTGQGPVLVIVPMDDWEQRWSGETVASARHVHTARRGIEPETVARLADLLADSSRPALLACSGNDSEEGWAALVRLAERLQAPVWQEPFASRAGFPQDHPLFAGHLPADRSRVREVLTGHDLLLAVGGPVLRQYPYVPEPLLPPAMQAAVVTADPAEAFRSPVELAVLGDPAVVVDALLSDLPARDAGQVRTARTVPLPDSPAPGEPLRAAHVFARLAGRLPDDAVLVEESPSSRPLLERMVPARRPLGFLSAAMGGLGFAMPAAIGVKMADPARPVVAVVGDGSSLYAIQSLWTAAYLQVGAVFVVMANGRYAVMDRLAERTQGKPPWPPFPEVSVSGLARSLGCPVVSFADAAGLDEAMATAHKHLTGQHGPLVLEATIVPDQTFAP
jgi:benzoylformate decarboxylase